MGRGGSAARRDMDADAGKIAAHRVRRPEDGVRSLHRGRGRGGRGPPRRRLRIIRTWRVELIEVRRGGIRHRARARHHCDAPRERCAGR